MILVVDDFHDSAEALARLFRKIGYPASIALNGFEALAFIRSHPPEQPLLVILDEMMPGMSGIEVLRQIRSDPRIASTGVVMHTAGFDTEARDEAITLGAIGWFLKGGTAREDVMAVVERIAHLYEGVGGAKLK
jgi:CheY-like chemotaxis protein